MTREITMTDSTVAAGEVVEYTASNAVIQNLSNTECVFATKDETKPIKHWVEVSPSSALEFASGKWFFTSLSIKDIVLAIEEL